MTFLLVIPVALVSVVIMLVYYHYMKKTTRFALAAVFLPLVSLPVYLGWLASCYTLIQGFREFAANGTGGPIPRVIESPSGIMVILAHRLFAANKIIITISQNLIIFIGLILCLYA